MSLVELPRVIPDRPARPEWGDAARPMRELTRAIAMDRHAWTPERAAQIASFFDSLASGALVNMFLFPAEISRVLADDGVLLWVSTNGEQTPIYLPPEDVLRALPATWEGVTARAGWGTWLTARRVGA